MFSFDDENGGDFRLTDAEGKIGLKRLAMVGLYILLGVVVLVTGAHAIMLVLSQAPTAMEGQDGLLTAVLNAIRIAFPITVELAAVVAGLGFISAKWRKGQKAAALMVEAVWVIFAAANMITFFRVERGLVLEGWQMGWINYGLPLSALIAGILTYSLTRTDPDLKRKDEETAAQEKIQMIRFAARRDVAISPQRQAIERQRAWIDFVEGLKSDGYSDLQIQFMLQGVPELMIDKDKDGNPDLLQGNRPRLASGSQPPGLVDATPQVFDTDDAPPPAGNQPRNGPPRRPIGGGEHKQDFT